MNRRSWIRRLLMLLLPWTASSCVQSRLGGGGTLLSSSRAMTKKVPDRLMHGRIPPKKGRSYLPVHDHGNQQTQLIEYVGSVPVYRHKASNAVLWKHGLMVDADGSPAAYSPQPGQGLDYLADAGQPGDWWALVTDNGRADGTPILQTRADPNPGYYVSTTSLEDPAYPPQNPRHWTNASAVPYIVLPLEHHDFGGRLGDYGVVFDLVNHRLAYVIVADMGPPHNLGEGSVALAKALKINPSAKNGGVGNGIGYLFFPNSGDGVLKTPAEIAREGAKLLAGFGGRERWSQIMGY